jgi:hypothetical protein
MTDGNLTIQRHGRDYVFFYQACEGRIYLHKNAYQWRPGADEGAQIPVEAACEELEMFRWEVEDRIDQIENGADSWER